MPRDARTTPNRLLRWAVLAVGALVATSLAVSVAPAPAHAANPVPGLVPSAPLGPFDGVGFALTTPVVDSTTHTMYAMASKYNSLGTTIGGGIVEVNDLTGQTGSWLTVAPGVNVQSGFLALDAGAHTIYYASLRMIDAIDTVTGAQVGLTQLPTGSIDGIAVDSATHELLVASSGSNPAVLSEFSGDLSTTVAQATLPQRAVSLAVDSVTRKAFLSEYGTALVEVDLPALTVGVSTPATQVDELAVDQGTGQLFARQLVGTNEALTAFSESTLAVTATPVPSVQNFVVDPTRGFVFASNATEGTVAEVDTSSDTMAGTVSIPSPNRFDVTAEDLGTGDLFDTGQEESGSMIPVLAAPSAITSAAPPAGSTWIDYSFTPTLSPAGASWSVYGNLPPGLALDPATGAISGTPTTAGTYTYTLTGRDAHGDGSAATYTQTIQLNRLVDRVYGSDRYQTAVAVAQNAFPSGAPIVFVASGTSFPDALSAAPAATKLGGPVLLTAPSFLPAAVSAEIASLHPSKIVVVGGTSVVSPDVQAQLTALVPNTVRWYGSDRFATSRVIDQNVWGIDFTFVYIATGTNFPDALAAGAVAGAGTAPLLLVNGGAGGLDPDTRAYLASQENQYSVGIAGGVNAVSAGIELDLRNTGARVYRFAGGDRYVTAMLLDEAQWNVAGASPAQATTDLAFLVTGLNFPDALAAGPWAGGTDAPMFLAASACVPNGVVSDLNALGVDLVVLVGGPTVLTEPVAQLTLCNPATASSIVTAKATPPGTALPRLDVASHTP